MAMSRRSRHQEPVSIWPGFVDAMTTLLLLLMFVLTIFLVAQFVLRETITVQDSELDALAGQVGQLADALGLEQRENAQLAETVGVLQGDLDGQRSETARQASLITTLTNQIVLQQDDIAEREARIGSFEEQVATLLAERDAARGERAMLGAQVTTLEQTQERLLTEKEALDLALASARTEVDAQAEAARLAASRREAIDALVADLRTRVAERDATLAETLARVDAARGESAALTARVGDLEGAVDAAEAARLSEAAAAAALRERLAGLDAELTEAEQARLADIAAAEVLRERLRTSSDELTAMTMALEAQRKRAEDTLTLLAAAEAGQNTAQTETASALSEAERQAALLSVANDALSQETAKSAESARSVALLNEQIAVLSSQLGNLKSIIDDTVTRDTAAQVQIETLGSELNSALATVAAEQRRRAELEEAERIRLQAEAQNLERYRSEFFGQLREVLSGREGVRIVGDRFVFSSEVLFEPAAADLAPEGREQIAGVVRTLQEVAVQIPDTIDWIIRVDGHTDDQPLSGGGAYANNWELSQARALAVVLYMINDLGFPPKRLAATGFGEYQPVNPADSPDARAQNRRIELKLTER